MVNDNAGGGSAILSEADCAGIVILTHPQRKKSVK
jgi:hypothetical protein